MRFKARISPKWLVVLGIPVLLLATCLRERPFSHTLMEKHWSIASLSQAQASNLGVAARRLDGVILKPGERFSFNRVVGPRTLVRGYRPAPSYLGGESPATLGGGICLLSSAVYQMALASGMAVEQRVPHLRTIHSVPPGLDATVWYGGADLRFANTLNQPIRMVVHLAEGRLSLALQGIGSIHPLAVSRVVQRKNRWDLLVTVFQARRMISRDRYRLSP